MEKIEIIKYLQKANPQATLERISIYADAFSDYRTAQANINEHGVIVFHPRTGAPIENPYLKIRAGAIAIMRGAHLKADDLWKE